MLETSVVELKRESMNFSAAHFTIFSATDRERLHGHNFAVKARITAPVGDNGMTFSYKVFKKELEAICDSLDEWLILPAKSPYLDIEEVENSYRVSFADEVMSFLKSDTLLLPIRNATVEEYSWYILDVRTFTHGRFVYGSVKVTGHT